MIIAEITPTAQQIITYTPFSSETVSLTHMTVWCRNYTPGSDDNIFTTQFGVPVLNTEGEMIDITIGAQEGVKLTQAELSTWGANDESLYNIVANKLGLTITSFTIT
jgi:hypothetical protein